MSLIAADLYWPSMGRYRGYLTLAVTPAHWFVDAPNRLLALLDESLDERHSLQDENRKLQADLLILARKLQRMESLTTENGYLRQLLNPTPRVLETAGSRGELLAEDRSNRSPHPRRRFSRVLPCHPESGRGSPECTCASPQAPAAPLGEQRERSPGFASPRGLDGI